MQASRRASEAAISDGHKCFTISSNVTKGYQMGDFVTTGLERSRVLRIKHVNDMAY